MTESIALTGAPTNQTLLLEKTLDKDLSLRLMEMGCLPGMRFEKLRTAPAKGLVLIKMQTNGSLLAMRHEEAENVIVQF